MRLTTAQALVRFLANQYSERDGVEQRLIPGMWGIFGHGNVAGLGQALLQYSQQMPYYLARNEQGQVHAAAAFAKMRNRLQTFACTTSTGPGSTNMVTGAGSGAWAARCRKCPPYNVPSTSSVARDGRWWSSAAGSSTRRPSRSCGPSPMPPAFPWRTRMPARASGSAWWDVPVSEVSELDSTRKAFENYSASKRNQKHYL